MKRCQANPLITPADVKPTMDGVEVYCTINPAAVWHDGEALLLVRVGERPEQKEGCVSALVYDAQRNTRVIRRYKLDDPLLVTTDNRTFNYAGKTLLTSMSHLRIARSGDLVHWEIEPEPAIEPTTEWESYGCEDARITPLDGRYYITYTAVSHLGVNIMLAATSDFRCFQKIGIIFPTFNKDACIFPEQVGGRYVCRHRPFATQFNESCIWTAWSPDLESWGRHSVLLAPTPGTWEGERVGAGAPPIKTFEGWLDLYHASDANGRYGLGAMLSDLEEPDRLITRSEHPVLEPAEPYEMAGVFSECVFSNGLLQHPDGKLTVFYGAADTVTASATTSVSDMIAAANNE